MENFPWIDKKITSIDLSNLSHALIVEGQEGVGKNQICRYLINGLLNEKNSQNLIKSLCFLSCRSFYGGFSRGAINTKMPMRHGSRNL